MKGIAKYLNYISLYIKSFPSLTVNATLGQGKGATAFSLFVKLKFVSRMLIVTLIYTNFTRTFFNMFYVLHCCQTICKHISFMFYGADFINVFDHYFHWIVQHEKIILLSNQFSTRTRVTGAVAE